MNKYLVKVDPDGTELLEIPPIWANSLAEATAEFIDKYPGPAAYTYTIALVPLRNKICIPFPIRASGATSTTYGTPIEASPLVIFESPADYGFPEYTTMTFRFKFRGYNTNASHGFFQLVTDNAGTGTYTAVANTEVEVTSTTIAQYTSGTDITLTPGNIYLVRGKCGAALQTTWIYGAWLIITFS